MKRLIIIAILLSCTQCFARIDYSSPVEGWTEEELKGATAECMVPEMYGLNMVALEILEVSCYHHVINEGINGGVYEN